MLYCKLSLYTGPFAPHAQSNAAAYEDVLEDDGEVADVALGEVHDLHGVIVDLDGPSHRCLGSSHVSAGDVGLRPLCISV